MTPGVVDTGGVAVEGEPEPPPHADNSEAASTEIAKSLVFIYRPNLIYKITSEV